MKLTELGKWNVRIYDGAGSLIHNWMETGFDIKDIYDKVKLTGEFLEGDDYDIEFVGLAKFTDKLKRRIADEVQR